MTAPRRVARLVQVVRTTPVRVVLLEELRQGHRALVLDHRVRRKCEPEACLMPPIAEVAILGGGAAGSLMPNPPTASNASREHAMFADVNHSALDASTL